MEVIIMESDAFYALIQEVVRKLKDDRPDQLDKWLDQQQAMQLLRIKSKTTLQKLRDEGSIRFTQPKKKLILYDSDSILEYLDQNARETF